MSVIKYFKQIDNSTRINILVNCEYLEDKFREEDMKSVDMSVLTKKHKANPIFDYKNDMCNCIYVDNGNIGDLKECIEWYNPVFICSIKCTQELSDYLNDAKYTFHSKTKMLYIFSR